VWFWNDVEPVGVVDALKKLAEIYHQLFKNRRKLFLSNLLTLQQWYLIIPLELFRVHMFKFLHKMVRQILVFLFLLLLWQDIYRFLIYNMLILIGVLAWSLVFKAFGKFLDFDWTNFSLDL
jgi:hypothetical protein